MELLKECESRVKSMALIHEKLYQTKNLAIIDYSEYIRGLVNSISKTYALNSNPVTIKVDAVNIL